MLTSEPLNIRGGLIFDGLGNEPREADVAIRDGRIVGVGKLAVQAGA